MNAGSGPAPPGSGPAAARSARPLPYLNRVLQEGQ